jgi:hypothetical protein
VDKVDVRTHRDKPLTPNLLLLQDMLKSALDSVEYLDPKRITLVTSYLKEDTIILDPDNCAIMPVLLLIASEHF